MSTVSYPHIEFTAEGAPMIVGTRTKVVEVVLDHLAHRWDAHEIRRQHPDLGLAQIHAALTYYYDHQPTMDAEIADQLREVEQIRSQLGESPLRAKLTLAGRTS